MKLLFMHLSDLHLSKNDDINEDAIAGIAQTLSSQNIGSINHVLVLVTGDIANAGKKNEYDAFHSFKELLLSALAENLPHDATLHMYIVPGNHDIDYDYFSNPDDRQYYETFLKNQNNYTLLDTDREVVSRLEFIRFSHKVNSLTPAAQLFARYAIALDGFSLEINLLNTTFFSLMHENDQGLHYLPSDVIKKLESPSGAMMAITLLHHSHQWFHDSCKRDLERALLEKNTFVFCGHEHTPITQEITYNGVSPAHVFCGGSLCNCGDWSNSEFFSCIYDTDILYFSQFSYKWDKESHIYIEKLEDHGNLAHKHSVEIPKRRIDAHIASLVEDQHIHISDNLADYYTFPGLLRDATVEDNDIRDIFEFEDFYQKLEQYKRIEISGSDSSGKSALLKMIFLHFLPSKYVIFCKVDNIVSGNRRNIIKSLFEYIYGEEKSDYDKFTRAKKENRIILIDDIHLISPKHISRFLEGIEEEFGYIVYTTNNLLKLDIQERIEAAIAKDSYSCFRLLPLYRKKRKQLVEKIIPLKYPTYTSKETTALVERICHILDLQRRYIPLTPEIILQFLEHYANYQMESAQNDGNIFSKVFESSLTNALSPHVTAPLTVDKTMLVLGKIAYYIHAHKEYPVSDKKIIDIINSYCEEYGTKVNSVNFIATVVHARILSEYGEDGQYKFTNNNYLAYFIASEICASKNIDAVEQCLQYACFGLNATILMFVTYLTNDTTLIDLILEAAKKTSDEWDEFIFGMPGFKHLEVQAPPKNAIMLTKEDMTWNQQVDDETDHSEVDKAHIDVVSIYDYNEEEITKLENQLVRAISLLMLISRCLPNFEHRLKKNQKEAIIKTIYQLPNKIFYAWAQEIEKCSESLVAMILSIETNDFTRKIQTETDAKRYLQLNSISLLLELYNGSINNAYRENTYDYLTGTAETIVDFQYETHQIERLLVFSQSKRIEDFCTQSKFLMEESKSPAAKLALACIVRQILVKGSLSTQQIRRLESTFSMEKSHSATVYRRYLEKKKEN